MVEILRVSTAGDSMIYKENGKYYSLDLKTNLKSGGMDSISSFTSSGGWRRATRKDKSRLVEIMDSSISVVSTPARKYRLPNTIKECVSNLNYDALASLLTVEEAQFLNSVSENEQGLTADEISQLSAISKKISDETSILSPAGSAWVNKIEKGQTPLTSSGVSFDDDNSEFFAVAPDPVHPTSADSLYKVEEDKIYKWVKDDFAVQEDMSPDTFEAPSILPIDNITAQVFATWLTAHQDDSTLLYNLEEADAAENNLMKLGEEEIEAEFADMYEALTAATDYFKPTVRTNKTKTLGRNWAKMMLKSYTPAERSANAKKQKRNSSGQFAPGGSKASKAEKKKTKKKLKKTKGKKARLTGRALTGNKAKRSKNSRVYLTKTQINRLQASMRKWVRDFWKKKEDQKKRESKKKGEKPTLGNTAQDTPTTTNNQADKQYYEDMKKRLEEYRRKLDKQDDARSITASIESADVDDIRYLALVSPDDHDAVTDIVACQRGEEGLTTWVRLKGEWVNDGDVKDQILGSTPPPMVELEDEEQIKDVISQVDEFDSSAPLEEDEDQIVASVYSEYGEIIPISAAADGIRGTERLKRYWTRGEGALKIRWGTKGDLTRCHRHLAKYLGPRRAWGYCQNRHQDIFGMSNAKRDRQGKK